MANVEFQMKDYLEEMRQRVTEAFKDKPVFDHYLRLLSLPVNEIEQTLNDLIQKRSIDTATGAQLDIIGEIVGQSRILLDADVFPYFGFEGALLAQSYGDLNNQSVGGYYYSLGQEQAGNIELTDEQYRLFIKAKIMKNITRATPEDVISFIKYVFNIDRIQIVTDGGAQASILLSEQDTNPFTLTLLRYFSDSIFRSYFVPKTIGVGIEFGTFSGDSFFAYQGVPDAKGYGDLNDPSVGGIYSRLIN